MTIVAGVFVLDAMGYTGVMNILNFIKKYVSKPRTVGAIAPSSRFLARKMINGLDFNRARCIVEYGPGTGVFTRLMLERRSPGTVLMLIERDPEFFAFIKERFAGVPDLYIINDSADQIGRFIKEYQLKLPDYIISGLPFASLPQDVSENVLTQTKRYLHPEGKFITFQYTLRKKQFIGQYFGRIKIQRELRNLPPAYVFTCDNAP